MLQVKEAEASVLERFSGKSDASNHGQRVVEGQHLMQSASDIFLGWHRVEAPDGTRDFYMRQLWDWKASAAVETMTPDLLGTYASMCAWTLARAHARSGDPIAIGAYLGSSKVFDRALANSPVPMPIRTTMTSRSSPVPSRTDPSNRRWASSPVTKS